MSRDGMFRYNLNRYWGVDVASRTAHTPLVIIMLNPSTADDQVDDPTIRRCVAFAQREGCNALSVVNLYAWRETSPDLLGSIKGSIIGGHANDTIIAAAARVAHGGVVAAWGRRPSGLAADFHARRVMTVAGLVAATGGTLRCLGTNKDGSPKHPLYLPADTELVPWTVP